MPIFNLGVNLDDIKEPEPVQAGEYKLQIISATAKKSKAGKDMISLMLEFLDEPNAAPVFHNLIMSPNEKADHLRLLDIKNFCQAFDVDYSRDIDSDALTGLSGWAFVEVEEPSEQNNQRRQNRIKRWVVGN